MDKETRDALNALRADVQGVDNRLVALDSRVVALDGRLATLDERVSHLDERVVILDGRVAALDGRVTGVEDRLTTVERSIREEGVVTRRHFDIVAERLRDDIRLIAERLVALDAKVEALRGSL